MIITDLTKTEIEMMSEAEIFTHAEALGKTQKAEEFRKMMLSMLAAVETGRVPVDSTVVE